MRKIKQWVNQLSVKMKLIFYGYLIITPVLILICAVLFYNYNKDLESRLENDRSSVNALAESIFVLQSDIKDFSTYFCINDEVHALLTAKNAEELNKNAKLWLEEAPMQIVQDMVALKGHIKTIGIYPENGVPLICAVWMPAPTCRTWRPLRRRRFTGIRWTATTGSYGGV